MSAIFRKGCRRSAANLTQNATTKRFLSLCTFLGKNLADNLRECPPKSMQGIGNCYDLDAAPFFRMTSRHTFQSALNFDFATSCAPRSGCTFRETFLYGFRTSASLESRVRSKYSFYLMARRFRRETRALYMLGVYLTGMVYLGGRRSVAKGVGDRPQI